MVNFRKESNCKLELHNFSVGSKITADRREWVVIATGATTVALVDLQTWEKSENDYEVVDPNWLTEYEVRCIVDLTQLNYTFSDFEFDEKGLKR